MGYMTFSEALKVLKEGKRVRRLGWRDRGKFLWLSKVNAVYSAPLGDKADTPVHPVICLYCPTSETDATVLPGWTPLQCDLLTDDWETV